MLREDDEGRKKDGLVYYTLVVKSKVLREGELLNVAGKGERRKDTECSPSKDLLQNPAHETKELSVSS